MRTKDPVQRIINLRDSWKEALATGNTTLGYAEIEARIAGLEEALVILGAMHPHETESHKRAVAKEGL